jgi:hypothetical protein
MVSIKGKINWKIFRRKTINQIEKIKETMAKELAKRKMHIKFTFKLSRVQIKSWAGKALETVNYCAFLKRTLIAAF